jgi:outer membrane protein TolC
MNISIRILPGLFVSLGLGAWALVAQAAPGATPPGTETMSLSAEDLPRLIQEKNGNVVGARSLKEAAENRTGHLSRSFLPNLSLQAGGEVFQTGPYSTRTQPYGSAEARINLFRGGRDALEEEARTHHVTQADASIQKAQDAELLEARRLYWKLVFNRELIDRLGAASSQNEKFLDAANRRIARGLSTDTDRLEFQIYRSELHEELESLRHETLLIETSLAASLALPSVPQFTTEGKIAHIHDDALLAAEIDPASHPDVRSLAAGREALLAQGKQAGRWWMPQVDAYGGYYLYTLRDRDYLQQGMRTDVAAGLKLTLEAFDGLQSKASAAALSAQAAGYERQAEQRRRTVSAQVLVAREELKHDHELIHQSEERIEQGRKYLQRTVDEYGRGVKNSIDVLSGAQRSLSFERQYAERKRDYQLTKAGLLALLGK